MWFCFGLGLQDYAEFTDNFGAIICEVFGFKGIVGVVVEFEIGCIRRAARDFPFDEAVTGGADAASDALTSGENVEGVSLHDVGGVAECCDEA